MSDPPLDSAAVAEITGFTPRWVRQKAAAGTIPGAIQVDAGGEWRFDRQRFLKWWNSKERAPCQRTYGVRSGGSASNGRTRPSGSRLEQVIAAGRKRLKETSERSKWRPAPTRMGEELGWRGRGSSPGGGHGAA